MSNFLCESRLRDVRLRNIMKRNVVQFDWQLLGGMNNLRISYTKYRSLVGACV